MQYIISFSLKCGMNSILDVFCGIHLSCHGFLLNERSAITPTSGRVPALVVSWGIWWHWRRPAATVCSLMHNASDVALSRGGAAPPSLIYWIWISWCRCLMLHWSRSRPSPAHSRVFQGIRGIRMSESHENCSEMLALYLPWNDY